MGTTMAGLAPGLSRKLKKVLESRTDTPEVLGSLNTLSTFYTDNNPQNRRNLRSTIEKRSLSINVDFLRASDTAQQVLPLICSFFSWSNSVANYSSRLRLCPLSTSPPIRRWIASRRRSTFLLIAVIGKTPLPEIASFVTLCFPSVSWHFLLQSVSIHCVSLSIGKIYT